MNLTWSEPRRVKNYSLIVVSAEMPGKGSPIGEAIWNIWRSHKEEFKVDGFGLNKDNYKGGIWTLNYYYNVPENLQTKDSTVNWKPTFDEVCRKWEKKMREKPDSRTQRAHVRPTDPNTGTNTDTDTDNDPGTGDTLASLLKRVHLPNLD